MKPLIIELASAIWAYLGIHGRHCLKNVHGFHGAARPDGLFFCWGLALELTPHHPARFVFLCEMRHEIPLCLE